MERPEEISNRFLLELEKHIFDIASGKVEEFYEIQHFASILCVHPVHLSNTIKQVTGKSPCEHCEGKVAMVAKQMLQSKEMSIAQIAYRLTYDPASFAKFFKRKVGQTPSNYRKNMFSCSCPNVKKNLN